MTKYLIFDTETTGIPPKNLNYNGLNWHKSKSFPYIVQLSWIYYDSNNDNIKTVGDHIIKLSENIEIPQVCSDIHGITNEISQSKGVPITDALTEFVECLKYSDILIAHNIEFDKKIIIAELRRNGFIDALNVYKFEEYCTMKNSIYLCKIIRNNSFGTYYKQPKLLELHEFLFRSTPRNLHNSLVDVIICMRCFLMMVERKDLFLTSETFRKLYEELC